MEEKKRARALCLLSGGLDSMLAVCVLKEQGVEVHGVVFDSPFFHLAPARAAADQLEIPLHIVNFSRDIISLLDNPKHGFGSCMNPCIDCHALMLRRAWELMEETGFDFLCTGEVLNERPMSQNRRAMGIVARDSGCPDLIVRPLSARLLQATRPEKMGFVDRDKLLAIEGRSRKIQFQLAEKYGLKDFPSPASGCRLTEPNFCRRLKDLKEHEGLNGERSINLLRVGRHFRLADNLKIIVGRNEKDNALLEGYAELYDLVFKVEEVPGPTGLMSFTAPDDQVLRGATICARYSDCRSHDRITIRVRSSRDVRRLEVEPVKPEVAEALRI